MTRTTHRIDQTLEAQTTRRSALRMISGGLIGGALAGVGMTAVKSVAAQPADRATLLSDLPVSGTASNGAIFDGTATVTALYTDEAGTSLYASGVLTGTLDDGSVVGERNADRVNTGSFASMEPIALGQEGAASEGRQRQAGCDVLSLVLGPLELDVLGLVVDIPRPIGLDVRADPAQGNPLGDLLCTVTGLLNGGSTGGELQQALDRINALLGRG